MSKTKEAIERKFPRWQTVPSRGSLNQYDIVAVGEVRGVFARFLPARVAASLVKDRNELVDDLIEASELLVEIENNWSVS